jgi:hypothetical protein
MYISKLVLLPLLLLPLAFLGCVFETSAPVSPRASAEDENPSALPSDYIAFFDGKETDADRTSPDFQVYNFNIFPWDTGFDPKGAERLFMFDPGLKRFWNSNLVPFPSI